MTVQTGETLAAVDLGSNSFHLIVARREQGQLQVIDRLREMVQLAAGLRDDGSLNDDARGRALECLMRFGQRLQGISPDRIRALATNTFRQMQSPRAFLAEAEQALGHPIEIISGREEARLIYFGVAQELVERDRRHLVVDIGGGSTELILGSGFEPDTLETVSLGCIGYSRRFFPDGVITRAAFKEAEIAAALELRPVRKMFRRGRWERAVGSSGTIRAVERVLANGGSDAQAITRAGVKGLRRAMAAAGHVDRLKLPGLPDERRSVFPGGVAILAACLRNFEIDEMTVSDGALRDGALHDLVGRVQHFDPRKASIAAFAARYRVDQAQAARVSATALTAFDQVAGSWQVGPSHRQALDWAARVHEVGLAIAHSGYHQHGAYLVENSELPGFSREDQLVLATLIRTHRRGLSAEVFATLPDRLVLQVTRLSALLRLAVLVHRSRLARALPPCTGARTRRGSRSYVRRDGCGGTR